MLKSRLDKAQEYIKCLRPNLVFVAIPWGMGKLVNEWINEFRQDYGLICLDRVDDVGERINRQMEHQNVLVYGTPPDDFKELDDLFDSEYALVWIYPNKQTDYFNVIKRIPLGTDRRFIPQPGEKIWARITACDPQNDNMLNKLNKVMTQICYEYQKKLKNTYRDERDGRILIVVV